jgi:hypothetical protein
MRLKSLLLVITVAQSSAQLPNERLRPEPTFLTYTAEAAGGYTGAVLGAAVGVAAASLLFPWGGPSALGAMAVVGFPAAFLGCAGGICVLGRTFRQDGKFGPTFGYTACATAVGGGLYYVGTRVKHGDVPAWQGNIGYGMTYVGVAAVVLAPVIATIGYNHSRPRDSHSSRFVPGSVGLAAVKDADGLAHPALNVHLLTVRF